MPFITVAGMLELIHFLHKLDSDKSRLIFIKKKYDNIFVKFIRIDTKNKLHCKSFSISFISDTY